MKLSDSYDGKNAPFQGDQVAWLRSIPAKAQIKHVTAKVTPVDATGGVDPFAETIRFNGNSGNWGTTKTPVPGQWVEVDFHNRRTLARVIGTELSGTTLQVDLGGAYVEINANGGIRVPGDPVFSLKGNSSTVPGLTVTKFKLTNPPPPIPAPATLPNPDISQVTIRSVPNNVNLRLGEMPPFWIHLGEMTQPETTPDFAAILQGFLANAQVENGFHVVPLMLHSDSIARLKVELEIEFLVQERVLPEGLNEVVLPFAFNTIPEARQGVLQLSVPANARVASGGTTGRVLGAFDETRIVYGPTGEVSPVGSVEVSPSLSQAQSILLSEAAAATAVDLLLSVTHSARLQLDLRDDLDGKPGSTALLPKAVSLELPGPVGQASGKEPKWVSVPLPAEVKFQNTRYWLVMQSIEGEVEWSAAPAPAGMVGMQRTQDGGLSWRDTTVPGTTGLLSAYFRLRNRPDRFQVPIELQVGSGDQAIRVNMDRFQPLGRVDFALDFAEVAQAFNQVLDKTAPAACPEGEHLANGDFEQWLRFGDKPSVSGIHLRAQPGAVAVKPDGSRAYVASMGDKEQALLQIIDVACNEKDEKVQDIPLPNLGIPKAFVISPDGTRGYVTDGQGLQVIDADTYQPLGNPLRPGKGVKALALSPDCGRLYVAEWDGQKGSVQTINTKLLEQVIQGQQTLEEATSPKPLPLQGEPTALAVAPDGKRLYVVIIASGAVQIFDTISLQPIDLIPVGQGPKGIALSPDGKLAVVANAGNNSVSIIDTASSVAMPFPNVGKSPIAVTISPEGTRAYVANQGDKTLSVIDLTNRTIAEIIPLKPSETAKALAPRALALIPPGNGVYVIAEAENESTLLLSVQLGIRLPAEWNLTSGQVIPICFPDPFHLIAGLGSPERPAPIPTALSQVVPVAASCPYEFSFWGIATQSDAVAEVLWLGQDCSLLQTDHIPIEAPPQQNESTQLDFTKATTPAFRKPQLLFHRAQLMAPAGASQAEVRFSVPADTEAWIDLVSLQATAEALANPDFRQQQEGQLSGWTLLPKVANGVSLLAIDEGIQLQNAGNDTAELVQSLPIKGGQFFALEFQGRAVVQPSAQSNPRIELRWLQADGSPAGSPTSLDILPTSFKSSAASGMVPSDATQVEIHLTAAPGTTLQMEQVSMRFSSPTSIPVTFIAQAPGELTVLELGVAFEDADGPPPRLPDQRLCPATPPGRQPGEQPNNRCFCPGCETEQAMTDTLPVVTRAGRQAVVGRCSACGMELARLGGAPVPGATPPLLRRQMIPAPIIHAPIATKVGTGRTGPLEVKAAGITPLTAISGIGEGRSRQLAKSGFDTLEKLVMASPLEVVQALGGVSIEMAAGFIEEAHRLLDSRAKKLEEKRGGANN